MRADQIVVMKDGSIVEHGSHDDLLRLKGKYFDLWANQIQLLNPDDKSNNKNDGKPARSRSNSPHKDKEAIESSRSRSKSFRKGNGDIESSKSRSKSPQKDKSGIVNDLGPERNQVELPKLAEAAKTLQEASHTGNGESQTSKVSIRTVVTRSR